MEVQTSSMAWQAVVARSRGWARVDGQRVRGRVVDKRRGTRGGGAK
jgi:hypothetical protein